MGVLLHQNLELFLRPRPFALNRHLILASCALTVLCIVLCGRTCLAQSKESSPAAPPKARALYQQLCQRCHAADGKGEAETKGVPNFTRRDWQAQKSDTQLIVSILDGKGTGMPTFHGQLNQAQAKELVSYVRAFSAAVPGQQPLTPTTSGDFKAQFQKLQEAYERLQKQLKELTPEQDSEKPAQESAQKDSDPEGTKETLRAAGVLFRRHCQRCHGTDGKGVAGKLDSPDPPDFTRRAWQDERSNARLLKSILNGRKKNMPAFGKDLGEDQARDLVDYIRAFTPPRRANSTKPEKDPSDGPCQRKHREHHLPTEHLVNGRLCIVSKWRGLVL